MEIYQIISLVSLIIIIIYSLILSVIYYIRSYESKRIEVNKSGKEILLTVLTKYNLKNINIVKIDGNDRYFYTNDTIFLSKDIYEKKNLYNVVVSGYVALSFIENSKSKYLIKVLSNLYSFLKVI